MKKIKLMLILGVFTLLIAICNNCYASSITKEQLKEALEKFLVFSEAENVNVEVTDSTINYKYDGNEYKTDYVLSDDKIVFESSYDVYQNMKYEEFKANQDSANSGVTMYPVIAKLKGVEYEESVLYFSMDLLKQAFGKVGETIGKENYVIIDDLNLEDGVTINKDKNDKYTIYASEFGDHAMEYVTAAYKEKQIFTDELKTYEMTTELTNVTENSCKVVSKFTINLNADFSKLKEKSNEIEESLGQLGNNNNNNNNDNTLGNDDNTNNSEGTESTGNNNGTNNDENNVTDNNVNDANKENNNANNNVNQNNNVNTENELPKAGIDFNYITAFNVIFMLSCVALGGIVITSFFKKKIKN